MFLVFLFLDFKLKKMRKKLFLLFTVISSGIFAQEALITIDINTQLGKISPYIYGANDHSNPSFLTSARQGGNRLSTYNWENNYSNAGKDYSHQTDRHLVSGLSSEAASEFAATPKYFIQNANKKHQYSLVTIQAGGYVASSIPGSVTPEEVAPSNRWEKVQINKDGNLLLTPNLSDSTVYMDEFVHYLVKTLGVAGDGGPHAYSIDNEPSLWSNTHPYMHPPKATIQEVISKSAEVAKMVKQIDRNAEVVGPALAGYKAIRTLEEAPDINAYNIKSYPTYANDDNWFFDEYLKAMKTASDEAGERLLDVVDIHWYPEEQASGTRIVNLEVANPTTSDKEKMTTDAMVKVRLAAPRELWDSTYKHTSWFKDDRICLLPNLVRKINQHYPETKLGITEFRYDAEYHFSGGLALTDVLGVFGREGVYLANMWDPVYDYAKTAYKMYLDYDGNGGTYGNTAVHAAWNDYAAFSAFASTDNQDNLHIIIINKTSSDTTINVSINNGLYQMGEVYAFGEFSMDIQKLDDITELQNNNIFSYTIKKYSANHIVLSPIERAKIVKAEAVSLNEVLIYTDSDILNSDTFGTDGFLISDGTTSVDATNAEMVNETSIKLTLAQPLTANNKNYTLSFTGSILDINNNPLFHCFDLPIFLTNLESDPYVVSAEIDTTGKRLLVLFSKMPAKTPDNNAFTLDLIDSAIVPSSTEIAEKSLILHFENKIYGFQNATLRFGGDTVVATDGSFIDTFVVDNSQIANNGPGSDVLIESVAIEDFGWTIRIATNKILENMNPDNSGFTITVNGANSPFSLEYLNNTVLLKMANRIAFGDIVSFSYSEQGNFKSINNGYLAPFQNSAIENTLQEPPAVAILPSKIQAEDVLYVQVRNAVTEEVGMDIDSTPHYAFTSANDIYVYRIYNSEEREYVLTIRHASTSEDIYRIMINNQQADSLFLESTPGYSNWQSTSMYITVPAGEHLLSVQMKSGGKNFNWMSIDTAGSIKNATIKRALVATTGTYMTIDFNNEFETIPTTDAFQITSDSKVIAITQIETIFPNSLKIYFNDTVRSKENVRLLMDVEKINFRFDAQLDTTGMSVINRSSIKPVSLGIVSPVEQLDIYPNPVKKGGNITIDVPGYFASTVNVDLIDIAGKTVLSKEITHNGQVLLQIPKIISDITALSIQDAKGNVLHAKIVVE